MHKKEELDMAILQLYEDYKKVIKKYKKGDLSLIEELIKINDDERNYNKEEVYYIGFNALLLLKIDIDNGNV